MNCKRTVADPEVEAHVHPPVATAVAEDAPLTDNAVTCDVY